MQRIGEVFLGFLGVIAALLACTCLHAQVFQAGRAHVVVGEENGAAFVDVLRTAKDGFPEVAKHIRFASLAEAQSYVHGSYPERQPVPVTRTETGDVLQGGKLWTAINAWSWEWENRYADWIRAEVDADFFVRYGIATDCADVAYGLRWIFARIHQLPMTSRLGSGQWFTQDSMRPEWLHLKPAAEWHKDKRFLAALDYVLNLTYTHTLVMDAYPVEIRPGAIMEGGFHLELHGPSGHTRPIAHVNRPGETGLPIRILQSTGGRIVRQLMPDGFWLSEESKKGEGGLLRFRWPKSTGNGLLAPDKMPRFSEEQFDPSFRGSDPFYMAVYNRLFPGFSLPDLANQLLKGTQDAILQRQQVVKDGYAYCQTQDCSPGTPAWEAWSTPSRDKRIGTQIRDFSQMAWMIPGKEGSEMEGKLELPFFTEDGFQFSLRSVLWALDREAMSFDPRVSPSERWGLAPAEVERQLTSKIRQTWGEREKFLQTTSSCPVSLCAPGSEEWRRRSSIGYDKSLIGTVGISESYCGFVPKAACSELNSRMQKPFDLIGPALTLEETLPRFLTLNSDPRLTAANRRTGLVPGLRPLRGDFWFSESTQDVLVALRYPQLSFGSARSLVQRTESPSEEARLWNLRGAQPVPIAPPPGYAWESFDLVNQKGWFLGPNEIGVREIFTGAQSVLPLSFVPKDISSSSAGGALVSGDNQWAFVSGDASGLKILASGPSRRLKHLDDTHWLNESVNGVEMIVAGGSGVQVLRSNLATLPAVTEVHSTDTGFFIHRFLGELWLIKREDASATLVMTNTTQFFPFPDGRKFLFSSTSRDFEIVEIDDRGAIVSRVQLLDSSISQFGTTVIVATVNGKRISYFPRAGGIVSAEALPGETQVMDLHEDLVLAARGPSDYVVRTLSDPTPIYRTPLNAFFLKSGGSHKGLLAICDTREGDVTVESHICRIEDVYRPSAYSLLTGLSDRVVYEFGRAARFKRGLPLHAGDNEFWIDF